MQDLAVTNENLSVVIFVATYFSFIGPRKPKLSMKGVANGPSKNLGLAKF